MEEMMTHRIVLKTVMILLVGTAVLTTSCTQNNPQNNPTEAALTTPVPIAATELPPTEAPLPTEASTNSPPASTPTPLPAVTETAVATATPQPEAPTLVADFMPLDANPILQKGEPGNWDEDGVFAGHVIYHEGLFHMFYRGVQGSNSAIGYASSPDGITFNKYDQNPILVPDGEGFDAAQIYEAVPNIEGGTWVLYYNAKDAGGRLDGPGATIGRTTAPSPTGSWSAGEPVLEAGKRGEWDAGFIVSGSILTTDDGLVMYYFASKGWGRPGLTGGSTEDDRVFMIGLATSDDGLTWRKYDDPATQGDRSASDPVFTPDSSLAWEFYSAWKGNVVVNGSGFGLFYASMNPSGERIGYAASEDGLHWTRYAGNPILRAADDPNPTARETAELELSSVVLKDGLYYVYYDYGRGGNQIGMATGTISTE